MTIHKETVENRDSKHLIFFPRESHIPVMRMYNDWNGGAHKFGAYYTDPADNIPDHIYNQFVELWIQIISKFTRFKNVQYWKHKFCV